MDSSYFNKHAWINSPVCLWFFTVVSDTIAYFFDWEELLTPTSPSRHSSGTYDEETDTGGSNGAGMRYEAEGGDPANAGLQHARVFLEPVKAKHSWITYADLWTLAGVVAIKEMGGPDIEWKGGRTDYVDDSKLPSRGRLPDGAQGADHLRFIFYRMGFNDQEIVALSGAHNLGRCHSDRSYGCP